MSKCGVHTYDNITRPKVDEILAQLQANGATIQGGNPWHVDVNRHNIKLQGIWDEKNASLAITVTDKSFIVPCSRIWSTIDPLIDHVSKQSD
jgi:hypothetical protein